MNSVDQAAGIAYAVAVVDDDPRLRTMLAMQVGETAQPSSFPTLEALESKTVAATPMVAILGPTYGSAEGLAAIIRVRAIRPAMSVILVVHELSTSVLQHAMRAGVSDVLALPVEREQMAEALIRAAESLPTAGAVVV